MTGKSAEKAWDPSTAGRPALAFSAGQTHAAPQTLPPRGKPRLRGTPTSARQAPPPASPASAASPTSGKPPPPHGTPHLQPAPPPRNSPLRTASPTSGKPRLRGKPRL